MMKRNQKIIAISVLVAGIAVLIYGITVEDEPTAVALILITTGVVWLLVIRYRKRP